MPVPLQRLPLSPGVRSIVPRFVLRRGVSPKSAIAVVSFDPPADHRAEVPGLTWSPAVHGHYQYLPAAPDPADSGPATVETVPITVPAGTTSATVRVLSWPDITDTDVPVRTIACAEATAEAPAAPAQATETTTSASWTPSHRSELCVDERLPGLPIHYRETRRDSESTDSLLVLMPAALSGTRTDRRRIVISRFTWADLWPTAEVLAVADPALQVSDRLNGAWFIHPDHDIPEAIAAIAAEKAAARGIGAERITFYGSSLGGFGAIAAASALPGARAIAEVPQIHFRTWMRSAVDAVEEHLVRMPIADYARLRPEQLSLPDRLIRSGNVPAIRLLTNPTELRLDEQLEFLEWARTSGLPRSGPIEVFSTDAVSGHGVLDKATIRALV